MAQTPQPSPVAAHVPFNVSYRQQPAYGGLSGLRNVPPSFMPRSHSGGGLASTSGGSSGKVGKVPASVGGSGHKPGRERPATAGSFRSGPASAPLASSAPFRSVAQWRTLLQGSEDSDRAARAVTTTRAPDNGPWVHTTPTAAAAEAVGPPLVATAQKHPIRADFADSGRRVDVVEGSPVGHQGLSEWLDGPTGADTETAEFEDVPGEATTKRLPWTPSRGAASARRARPASATSRKGKGKEGVESPRQVHYLEGIVVRMGAALPRKYCAHLPAGARPPPPLLPRLHGKP
jgi:hypothetical protein